jgi:hypothetical protein
MAARIGPEEKWAVGDPVLKDCFPRNKTRGIFPRMTMRRISHPVPQTGPARFGKEVPSTKRVPALALSLPRWGIDFKPKTRKIWGKLLLE